MDKEAYITECKNVPNFILLYQSPHHTFIICYIVLLLYCGNFVFLSLPQRTAMNRTERKKSNRTESNRTELV